jgi:hypothetical protein
MFSLGMVVCTIFNSGKPLIQAQNSPSAYLKQLESVSQLDRNVKRQAIIGSLIRYHGKQIGCFGMNHNSLVLRFVGFKLRLIIDFLPRALSRNLLLLYYAICSNQGLIAL